MENEKRKYTAVALWRTHIHDLRNLAREMGVHAPTTKNKKTLVDEIILIQNGQLAPVPKSNRGRPRLK